MQNLTSASRLNCLLNSQREWLLTIGQETFSLLSEEIVFETGSTQLSVKLLTERGVFDQQVDRVTLRGPGIELTDKTKSRVVNLVPRASAAVFRDSIEEARNNEAENIARRLELQYRGLRVQRVALNERYGRFAEINAQYGLKEIFVLADVSEVVQNEDLLARGLGFRDKFCEANTSGRMEIWVLIKPDKVRGFVGLFSCLSERGREDLVVLEQDQDATDESKFFKRLQIPPLEHFWNKPPRELSFRADDEDSGFTSEMRGLLGEDIDVVRTRNGETIRFRGLVFARTRRARQQEMVWFGMEDPRVPLTLTNQSDLADLIANLRRYRKFESPNKQHEFYRAAPEAWLESLLRRNIRALDRNLVLSPIYNQFRAAREKIDLLALRTDGRLVVIELKVNEDRSMLFQAVDYWRRIERYRRAGTISAARLFGEREVSELPTLVYLAAPKLSLHPDLEAFERQLVPQIEVCTFELFEDWRRKIGVSKRRGSSG